MTTLDLGWVRVTTSLEGVCGQENTVEVLGKNGKQYGGLKKGRLTAGDLERDGRWCWGDGS